LNLTQRSGNVNKQNKRNANANGLTDKNGTNQTPANERTKRKHISDMPAIFFFVTRYTTAPRSTDAALAAPARASMPPAPCFARVRLLRRATMPPRAMPPPAAPARYAITARRLLRDAEAPRFLRH
jgi:hypothetical protein